MQHLNICLDLNILSENFEIQHYQIYLYYNQRRLLTENAFPKLYTTSSQWYKQNKYNSMPFIIIF